MLYFQDLVILGLFITILSEFLLVYIVFRDKASLCNLLLIVFAVHFISHPTTAILFYVLSLDFYIVELYAIIIESILYRLTFIKHYRVALILSLSANILSVLIGSFIR